MKPIHFFVFTFFFSFQAYSLCGDINLRDTEEYEFHNNIEIKTFDGEKLSANLLIPKNTDFKHPTIIFGNSWILDEHEYLIQAKLLAKEGFQVISYSTRGWGCSSGYVDVMGPIDMLDLRYLIDWLEDNTNVDVDNIGISGISYGGGLSLMGMAYEPRIKTAFAMSTWTDLEESLLGQGTLRSFWGGFLASSGMVFGKISPRMQKDLLEYTKYKNLNEFKKWSAERSPINYLNKLVKKPIYLANNLGDNLFQPNQVIKFFNKLSGPKVLELNQGSHLTAEFTGLVSKYNKTFDRMREWFKHWLQNKPFSTIKLGTITVDVNDTNKREVYKVNQLLSKETLNYYFFPSKNQRSVMTKLPYVGLGHEMSFDSNRDSWATSGIPFLSAVIDAHVKVPVYTFSPIFFGSSSLIFETDKFKKDLALRGISKIKLNVSAPSKFQMVSYLYEVNSLGLGRLLTHGVLTSDKLTGTIEYELVAMANNISRGNRLMLVIDGEDILYGEIPERRPVVKFQFNSFKQNKLILPIK